MFLMWLGEQITSRGIGNGISLIIFAGIVANIPSALAGTLELGRQGALSTPVILMVVGAGDRRRRRHRLRRARAAAAPDPVSEAPDRQPDVPGRFLAPAAEAQHRGRHPADLRVVAAAPADHGRQFLGRPGAGLADHGHGAARPRPAALHAALRGDDRLLRLLLHGGRLQPDGHGRQAEEARRLHSRASGRASARPNTSTTC